MKFSILKIYTYIGYIDMRVGGKIPKTAIIVQRTYIAMNTQKC